MTNVGIAGIGVYLPEQVMTAKEIAAVTDGVWTEEAIREKLGINQKYIAGPHEGTQEMGALASLDLLETYQVDPAEIDVILCFGEEWKEYPLTTSALCIQDRIGAVNAWGVDIQNRCCTTVTALKMAKDMLIADEDIDTILVAGGYRNGDLVDYTDRNNSMLFDLSAGGGAILLKKNHPENLLLGSHIMSDGSLSRTAGMELGGTMNPVTPENVMQAQKSLKLLEPTKMKERLNEVSMKNWMHCIDRALEKSGYTQEEIGYLNILHMKRSGHLAMVRDLGLEQGKITDGTIVCSIAAGIGYVWAADIIKWGKADG